MILPELVEQRLSRPRRKPEAAAVLCPIPFRVRGSRNFSARGQRLEDLLDAIANGCLASRRPQFCDHLVPAPLPARFRPSSPGECTRTIWP